MAKRKSARLYEWVACRLSPSDYMALKKISRMNKKTVSCVIRDMVIKLISENNIKHSLTKNKEHENEVY